jgi:hypothetical protein
MLFSRGKTFIYFCGKQRLAILSNTDRLSEKKSIVTPKGAKRNWK